MSLVPSEGTSVGTRCWVFSNVFALTANLLADPGHALLTSSLTTQMHSMC